MRSYERGIIRNSLSSRPNHPKNPVKASKLKKNSFFREIILSIQQKHITLQSQTKEEGVFCRMHRQLGYGVIGNTTDSGPVILGSSPDIPTEENVNNSVGVFLFRILLRNGCHPGGRSQLSPKASAKIFVKPDGQSQACLSYAMARKFARSECIRASLAIFTAHSLPHSL